jgi:FKBP12-rapamycin complex-associated protein
MVPLLPFVKDVAACYLSHPSSEVRKAASLTCCTLLIPSGSAQYKVIGGYTGTMVECVLESLLQTAASDPSISVRLCVVQALDSRYDTYLCQSHHLRELFLLLQDEALAVKAAGLRLLGRLASINPGPILPVLRRLLNDLIVELQCGASTGRVREEATRLLVVYLRASPLQRLVHPLLHTLINALPLDKAAPPRLASASLEALGELAHASGYALKPWVDDVVPHVLEIMEDKSSASKQRTSLRTLGQIAGSTGYVIQPYLDYPKLLTQATEILPATKRAPWSLRREVIRTLGILGALDPDRYHEVASKTGKGGAVGGAYFENELRSNTSNELTQKADKMLNMSGATNTLHQSLSSSTSKAQKATSEPAIDRDADENEPAAHFMYEQYAMTAQPVTSLPPSKRTTPLQEGFYPAVAIQALMRIFRDSSLVVHHGMVVQAVMFIFKSLGVRSVPFLNKFVPDMIYAVKFSASSNLRESLLMQLAGLSAVVREHLRPYTAQIFEVISQFWGSRHMSTILELISSLAVGSPDEFRLFVPTLIQLLLSTFDAMHVADWTISPTTEASGSSKGQAESQKLRLVLNSIFNLKDVFGEYLRIIVPALLKLAHSFVSVMYMQDSQIEYPFFEDISVLVYRTVSSLVHTQGSGALSPALYNSDSKIGSQHNSENGLPACAVQPLVRTLLEKPPRSPAVGFAIVETLCVCAVEIGGLLWFHLYDAVVRDAIEKWQESFPPPSSNDLHPTSHRINGTIFSCLDLYDAMIKENLISDAFNVYSIGTSALNFGAREHDMAGNDFPGYFDTSNDGNEPLSPQTASLSTKLKVNQGKLQRAWDVSQRTSRDDWDEWMRRFAIQLLREAPSPSLRACSSLAHAYQPLSRELFSASFACCWKELSSSYRADLVEALKAAFVADISPEILQALLNLAEFMEFDPANVLPIEIPVLAELALKCRAYAKALHYAERQYHLERTSACVESLISINGKLDLPGT